MNESHFSYPYITSEKDILNGAPIIQGTRIPVRSIAGYYQIGMNADEILEGMPNLTPSQLFSALAYYFDHQDEIDRDLKEASDTEYWKTRINAGAEKRNIQ